jgi:mono/diheme cytochrome c family protein
MSRPGIGFSFIASLVLAAAQGGEPPASSNSVNADRAAFFEAQVRPILAGKCLRCHGAERQKGGLRLDSPTSLLQGGDDGPVIVPGSPEKSLIVQAVRWDGRVKMPPKEKLSEEAIGALVDWVKMGAPVPDPAKAEAAAEASSIPKPRSTHWAFQPIGDPPPPQVEDSSWASSPIDLFILEKLESKGLYPSKMSDPRTLLRRASIDLTGLPPTIEEVEAFAADRSPDAFARQVDRLLASPRHGERWGRHWLDVARYADTKGYVFEEERRFPNAYTYRDYVIRSLNEDLPYDRFLVEQLAADLLPHEGDPRSLAAMGFLTLGRRFLNNLPDIIDDRIDVSTRGLMGLTVTCARCHDHKFDPIPTADYYSLYGVFASATEPKESPLIGTPEKNAAYEAFEKELAIREAAVNEYLARKRAELSDDTRKRAGEYLLVATVPIVRSRTAPAPTQDMDSLPKSEPNPQVLARWKKYLEETGKAHHPVMAPWHAFAALPPDEFAFRAPQVTATMEKPEAGKPINPLIARAFSGAPPASINEAARRYAEAFAAAEAGEAGDPARDEVRKVLHGEGSPAELPLEGIEGFFDRGARGPLRERRKKVDEWKATGAGAPARAMSLVEAPRPVNPVIFIRGNAGNPGREVPRQLPQVIAPDRKPFKDGSGRLEVARAIASKDNPLTARVIVNRVWMHHFGEGLVRTPGDFGARSDPPSHPELLDWLASRFIEDGWSLKKLHRRILLSSVWRQGSADRPTEAAADPENRLLWRANRRRLDFESMRDTFLSLAGRLDPAVGGPPVDIVSAPFSGRRSVYGFIDRQNVPGLFRVFDVASPDASCPRRYVTTVPQQALYLLNSPFVLEMAKALATRPEVRASDDPRQRIAALHRLVFAREPRESEIELALKYIVAQPEAKDGKPDGWARYAQVLLFTSEFAFLD